MTPNWLPTYFTFKPWRKNLKFWSYSIFHGLKTRMQMNSPQRPPPKLQYLMEFS